MSMEISVVVITYNRSKQLARCLRSLVRQDFQGQYEVIVVDDGSTDSTRDVVLSFKNKRRRILYWRKQRGGYASARNFGLRRARGRIIAFTDDDCVVGTKWLQSLQKNLVRHKVDAVGGSVANPVDTYVAWAHYLSHFSSWLPAGRRRVVENIPTVNVAYTRDSIRNISFPEYMVDAGYEDSLFNHTFHRSGKIMLFCPDIRVEHFACEGNMVMRRFFQAQKRTGRGFICGGYVVHGTVGSVLARVKFVNLACPRLALVFYRCTRYGYLWRFLMVFPLVFIGEFYRGMVIFCTRRARIKRRLQVATGAGVMPWIPQ
jgi:glycosyltransferase involved in cell wall biosynthesis